MRPGGPGAAEARSSRPCSRGAGRQAGGRAGAGPGPRGGRAGGAGPRRGLRAPCPARRGDRPGGLYQSPRAPRLLQHRLGLAVGRWVGAQGPERQQCTPPPTPPRAGQVRVPENHPLPGRRWGSPPVPRPLRPPARLGTVVSLAQPGVQLSVITWVQTSLHLSLEHHLRCCLICDLGTVERTPKCQGTCLKVRCPAWTLKTQSTHPGSEVGVLVSTP